MILNCFQKKISNEALCGNFLRKRKCLGGKGLLPKGVNGHGWTYMRDYQILSHKLGERREKLGFIEG